MCIAIVRQDQAVVQVGIADVEASAEDRRRGKSSAVFPGVPLSSTTVMFDNGTVPSLKTR